MVQLDIARSILIDFEVAPKAARGETIRSVRIMIGRQKPAETGVPAPPLLPRSGSEVSGRGQTT